MPPFPSPAAPLSRLVDRRGLLRFGAAASLVPAGLTRAAHATSGEHRSVILLWMAGGVTHHESFDPKPDAPAEIRGSLRAIPTALPGVRFTEVMPHLASAAGS